MDSILVKNQLKTEKEWTKGEILDSVIFRQKWRILVCSAEISEFETEPVI